MAKILIAVIHGPYEPWLSILKNGQRKTWMSQAHPLRVVNAFGRPISARLSNFDKHTYYLRWNKYKIIAYAALGFEAFTKKIFRLHMYSPPVKFKDSQEFGEVWEIQMPDSLILQGVKNMSVFRESLNVEYDFLVTTITSTYLNTQKLSDFLSTVRAKDFAGGRIEKSGSLVYQQGSFRVYSRDVVEKIVCNSKLYKHWKIEDIAMGCLVETLGLDLVHIPNTTLSSVSEALASDFEDLNNAISIRCKSQSDGVRFDQDVMFQIQKRLYERNIPPRDIE